MASTSPSPSSSPSAVPPTPNVAAPPPSNSSTTPPRSPPPSIPAAPPRSAPQSPPSQPPILPPPAPPASPPPTPSLSPPPSPPISPPPSPPAAPPAVNPPPPSNPSPPPTPGVSPPPPPQVTPSPPVLTPPPAPSNSTSPPPPANVPSPPSPNSPPPPAAQPPKNPVPRPVLPPPPSLSPPQVPSPPLPPSISPAPPGNQSKIGRPPSSPLPSVPTEKPTAKSTADDKSGNSNGLKGGGIVALGMIVGLLALSLVVLAVWFRQKRKRRSAASSDGIYVMPSPFASSQNSESSFLRTNHSTYYGGTTSGSNFVNSPDPGGAGNSKSWFTYQELAEATNGFSANNILGEGGFGCVYKGCLEDGREVAVKQLKIGGGQGEREFRAEVEIISRVHHRHLVSLVGYCISEHQRLLVYDYVPNNTLHFHLHAEGRPVMDWTTRVKVAAGAARGIAYLHEDCNPRIIHRDIKSSNILLDNNFEARVADFGLAKLALDANTHVTTRVMGTFGYMAPEYASSGKLTEKSDVFSFGVVLLELITGRKSVDASQPLGDESLVEWARPLLARALNNEGFDTMVDPRLGKSYIESEMFRMIEAAAACVRHLASKRPRMSQVVRAFDSIDEVLDLTNGMRPGQSEMFDSRQQSAQIRMFERMAFGSQDYSSSEFFDHSHISWRS